MKKVSLVLLVFVLAVSAYLAVSGFKGTMPTANAAGEEKKTYSGTIYVAGMGGHFAAADITIDPASAKPITITKLDRIVIGNKDTHPTHDPRIDVSDRNVLFWSTYKADKALGGDEKRIVHIGKSNLKTGEVIKDVPIKIDDKAKWIGAVYCASGQSAAMYMPVTMTDEAYIDVVDKKTLELKHRVFLPYKPGETKFYHGTNSPDMKKFAVAVNRATEGKPDGKIDILLLDMEALEKGQAKILKKTTLTGVAGKTLTFRQSFTPDGKYLLQSAADRFWLLDGSNLNLIDEEMLNEGQNHDAVSTADNKFAVLTLREMVESAVGGEGKDITDGTLLLYDITTKSVIGTTSSACYACHKNLGIHGNATLCGADVNWK